MADAKNDQASKATPTNNEDIERLKLNVRKQAMKLINQRVKSGKITEADAEVERAALNAPLNMKDSKIYQVRAPGEATILPSVWPFVSREAAALSKARDALHEQVDGVQGTKAGTKKNGRRWGLLAVGLLAVAITIGTGGLAAPGFVAGGLLLAGGYAAYKGIASRFGNREGSWIGKKPNYDTGIEGKRLNDDGKEINPNKPTRSKGQTAAASATNAAAAAPAASTPAAAAPAASASTNPAAQQQAAMQQEINALKSEVAQLKQANAALQASAAATPPQPPPRAPQAAAPAATAASPPPAAPPGPPSGKPPAPPPKAAASPPGQKPSSDPLAEARNRQASSEAKGLSQAGRAEQSRQRFETRKTVAAGGKPPLPPGRPPDPATAVANAADKAAALNNNKSGGPEQPAAEQDNQVKHV